MLRSRGVSAQELTAECVSIVALVALTPCGCKPATTTNEGDCFILNIAQIQPRAPRLNIGDTLKLRASFAGIAPQCLPRDTTAAGLRWSTANGIASVDSTSALVVALRPGLGTIYVSEVGTDSLKTLGSTDIGVFEPVSADSIVTVIRNVTNDTTRVVIQDAAGITQGSVLLKPSDSVCTVTPLADSVGYRVSLRPSPPPWAGFTGDSTVKWVSHAGLQFNHTWFVLADSVQLNSGRTVTVNLFGRSPDPGVGCS
jgi:hypothetical protein